MDSLNHPFPQRPRPYQDHRPACTLPAVTVRQLRIREPTTPRDREPSLRGIIAFILPLPFVCPPLPPLTIVFTSLDYVFRFGFFMLLLRFQFFWLWLLELAFHLVLFLVSATIRVVVLVFGFNLPSITLDRLVFVRGRQTCRISNFCFLYLFGVASRRSIIYRRP